MALPCLLALVLACGQGRTDGQDTGAAAGGGAESGALPADTAYPGGGIDDTTAAPSVDATDTAAPAGDTAAPAGDTAAPTGDTAAPTGDTAAPTGDTAAPAGGAESSDTAAAGATSDTTY
jgi:hypothetical protein